MVFMVKFCINKMIGLMCCGTIVILSSIIVRPVQHLMSIVLICLHDILQSQRECHYVGTKMLLFLISFTK